MKKRIHIYLCLISVISILVTVGLCLVFFHNSLVSQTKFELKHFATMLINTPDESLREIASIPAEFRATLIGPNGNILFDTKAENSEMANHLSREEIVKARDVGEGFSIRKSQTIGEQTAYYAVAEKNGNILRISKNTDNVWSTLFKVLPNIIFACLILFIVTIFLSRSLTKRILMPIEEISNRLDDNEIYTPYEELEPLSSALYESNVSKKNKIEELKKQRDQIDFILNNMEEGLLIVDSSSTVLLVNKSAKEYLNVSSENIIGKNLVYLMPTEQPKIPHHNRKKQDNMV